MAALIPGINCTGPVVRCRKFVNKGGEPFQGVDIFDFGSDNEDITKSEDVEAKSKKNAMMKFLATLEPSEVYAIVEAKSQKGPKTEIMVYYRTVLANEF